MHSYAPLQDHAAYDYEKLEVVAVDSATGKEVTHYIELWYFGVFDGHAGGGASIFSSKNLQKHIISALRNIGHLLIKEGDSGMPRLQETIQYLCLS